MSPRRDVARSLRLSPGALIAVRSRKKSTGLRIDSSGTRTLLASVSRAISSSEASIGSMSTWNSVRWRFASRLMVGRSCDTFLASSDVLVFKLDCIRRVAWTKPRTEMALVTFSAGFSSSSTSTL
eukprot:scaffold1355_cov268-Pinguiococcus_pyrenoidosus.AAC.48